MPATDLALALKREHEQIDGGIEAFVRSLTTGAAPSGRAPGDGAPDRRPLEAAFEALRRHIYLEEAFLFPALQSAGLWAALLVMHREHGQIWRSMDRLASLVGGWASAPTEAQSGEALSECRALLDVLDRHNGKEEPIIYPRTSTDLTEEQAAELAEFLRTGTTPPGWVCREAGT